MGILESINGYAVSVEADKNGYSTLIESAINSGCTSKGDWDTYCYGGEVQFCEQEYASDPNARKKSTGEWKFRTLLPQAYTSAKSVIGTALDHCIPLVDENGNPMGKSALQNRIKASKDEASDPKTEVEKAQAMLESVLKISKKADSTELYAILDSVEWLATSIREMT